MSRHHTVVGLAALLAIATTAPVATAVSAAGLPRLVEVRAAHHPGIDRVVLQFDGGLPELSALHWATRPPTLDPSGLPSHVQGNAFVSAVFQGATGTSTTPPYGTTYGSMRRAWNLPNASHLVVVGDWEGVIEIAIGVMARTDVLRSTALHSPSRWVIEIGTHYPKRVLRTWFLDEDRVNGPPPFVVAVPRTVPRDDVAESLLHRLFAGPTDAERSDGLRFIASEATGFADLRVNDMGVARVRLVGGCDGHGSTIVTVASEVMPTLRQLSRVSWVKVLDPAGETGRPRGQVDSIPSCLEP